MRPATLNVVMCAIGALTGACPDAELAHLEPCTVSGVVEEVSQNGVDKLDLLFVVDDSVSMLQEQQALAQELPRMVRLLTTGDRDGNGEPDFPPVRDMHLGLVSTDMGAAGNENPKLHCVQPGKDGRLLYPDNCGGRSASGNFLEFHEGDDPQALGEAFACGVTQVGTEGCGLEQQLDAMLKALTAPDSGTFFFGGSTGHGGPAAAGTFNAGFLREEAVLAVIVVTDEDDCSLPDESAELFSFSNTEGAFRDQPLNLRCGLNPDRLHPVSRYHEGLLALKPQNPELVIFAAITGIPEELEGQDPQLILQDPTLTFASDTPETDPSYLAAAAPRTSCEVPNQENPTDPQKAYPPRRIVETAGLFGANGTVQSICKDDFSGALNAVIDKISKQLRGPCLPRPLIRTDQGLVACDIFELIEDEAGAGDALCDASRGREPGGLRSVTHKDTGVVSHYQACKINQVAVRDGSLLPNPATQTTVGWYYDDFSEDVASLCSEDRPQLIQFTAAAQPPPEATVRFECLQPVVSSERGAKGQRAVGLSCEKDAEECARRSCTIEDVLTRNDCKRPFALSCEPGSNTCQIDCGSTADCPVGWSCRANANGPGMCVLPTCPALNL